MQIHQLKPKFNKKLRKRVGRGGKKGTYSGRGIKGQNSRSGKGPRAGFAGGDTTLLKRLPKKRGVVGKVKIKRGSKLSRYKINPVILNLKDIEKNFKDGDIISPKILLDKKMINRVSKRIPRIKILGVGEFKNKFIFKGIKTSKKVGEILKKVEKEPKKVEKKAKKKVNKN